jgi:RNA polymerase sigma-70 factor, ECF subfamily
MNDSHDVSGAPVRSKADQKLRALVELMKSGSERQVKSAQIEFYTTLRSQLAKTGIARGIDEHRFKDLFQETMIAVWNELPNFRGESSMVTWVHSIFRFKLADYMRSSEVRRVEQLADEIELESSELDIPVALSRQQVQRFLEGCLARLRKKSRRRALAMDYVRQEYSMDEIAASFEVPVGTVKRWLFEARQELGACIQMHGATGIEG